MAVDMQQMSFMHLPVPIFREQECRVFCAAASLCLLPENFSPISNLCRG